MMHSYAPRKRSQIPLIAAAIASAGIIASVAITALSGTKTGTVLAAAAVGGPVLMYLAIVAPLVFPFGVYAALIPFNNLLNIDAFGTLTKAVGIVTGAAIVFYLVRTRRTVRPPLPLVFWSALFVWSVTTAFWALDPQSVFNMLPTTAELLLLYAVVSVLPTDRNAVRWSVVATIVGGVMAAAYGAYLFHSGLAVGSGRLWIKNDTSEIDPNQFAAALLLPLALTGCIALYARRFMTLAATLVIIPILLLGIAESGSRGAMLALAVMVVYLLIRSERRIRLALFTFPVGLLGLIFLSTTSIWSRFGNAVSTGGAGRIPIWRVGVAAIPGHWLLGAGLNNFGFAYDEVFLQTHQAYFANWHRAPHDLLIGTTVELGLIGLTLLLAGWISQFRTLRDIRPSSPDHPLRLALEATVIGTFVAALFLDVMTLKYLWLTFMLMLIVRNANITNPRQSEALSRV